MVDLDLDENAMRDVLTNSKVIAVVGMSDDHSRASYRVAKYLENAGYKIYPVNPLHDEIDGQKCYKTLDEVPEPIDIVDVFRRAEYIPEVVEDAIRVKAKTVWVQLGIRNDDAQRRALEAGLNFVMDSCIKVDHMTLAIPHV